MVLAVEISFMALLHKNISVKSCNSIVKRIFFFYQTNSTVTQHKVKEKVQSYCPESFQSLGSP